MPSYFAISNSLQGLVKLTEAELLALWDEVASRSTQHQAWIDELDVTLAKIEDKRMEMVKDAFFWLFDKLSLWFVYCADSGDFP